MYPIYHSNLFFFFHLKPPITLRYLLYSIDNLVMLRLSFALRLPDKDMTNNIFLVLTFSVVLTTTVVSWFAKSEELFCDYQ
jgi:hypothetical protein